MTPVPPNLARTTPAPVTGVAHRPAPSSTRDRHAAPALLWLALLAGSLLVSYAYSYAATHPRGEMHFHLFWLGVLAFTLPAAARLCSSALRRNERFAILAAVGLFSFLPKFLRSPDHPLFIDELAHWRQAETIHETGRLFQPNPTNGILEYFPGLHSLTVVLRTLTGADTFVVATILLALLHVLALVGVFVLVERMLGSARTAGLAAFVYGLSPGFMFFNSQYSYESLAIVFFIWVLVAVAHLERVAEPRGHKAAWFVAGLLLAAAAIVTHHLSSYALAAVLVLIQVVSAIRVRRGEQERATALLIGIFSLAVAVGATAWLLFIASKTVTYISPHLADGVEEIVRLIAQEQESRLLFRQSMLPGYERAAAFLSPAIAGACAVVGLSLWRRRRPSGSAAPALVVFGLLYFPSLPFILTQAGQEGARRSWAFTYLGLCVLIAISVVSFLQRWSRRGDVGRRAALVTVMALLGVIGVGNVAVDVNAEYRFPGRFVYGSDTRSLTAEVLGATRWFRDTQGVNENVVADRYTGISLAAFARAWTGPPSEGFPLWDLYFRVSPPSASLLAQLKRSDYEYMVIDKRMSRYLPRVGVYFVPDEPAAFRRKEPPPPAALLKYERLPYMTKIYASYNLAIYRFNFSAAPLLARAGRT